MSNNPGGGTNEGLSGALDAVHGVLGGMIEALGTMGKGAGKAAGQAAQSVGKAISGPVGVGVGVAVRAATAASRRLCSWCIDRHGSGRCFWFFWNRGFFHRGYRYCWGGGLRCCMRY
ncbi:MAG: hypothetical protein H7X76_06500 [Prolixibacteraceae bacterium]|nr:hypothetical protein [Burkholderiales bacterium]